VIRGAGLQSCDRLQRMAADPMRAAASIDTSAASWVPGLRRRPGRYR